MMDNGPSTTLCQVELSNRPALLDLQRFGGERTGKSLLKEADM